ncbi:sulfotransferase family protein [Aurantiacibacter poecillastricola]|uniref:sulfotransferase family protein n=1 Tax=Aurantiacibacter poecillastricola TaxID=3064385 RepID=UPI00273FAC78|nr:sulfotransferase family protein [Aurantiacibacter sp. 219JJ12-13]MDP5262568.1 sulfotransferase [Aurantiacibacter sp. 219JJ12-13]
MTLDVIGAGPGRTATFSMKFALEHIGFGPCYHMSEVFRGATRNIELWQDVADGNPDWDAIFDGYRSTTDFPASIYWRELAEYYPQSKVVLTVRNADTWFDSVNETIMSPRMLASLKGSPLMRMFEGTYLRDFGDGKINDRAFMTDWYERHNQAVIDTIPAERLLVFHPREGWEPLCDFLGVSVPDEPFPKVNSRDELGSASDEQGGLPSDPLILEGFAGTYIEDLRSKAFG